MCAMIEKFLMWFIKEKLQVIELIGWNPARQEKRARQMVTRPEPTIYGNCDSWNFIVGKKPIAYIRKTDKAWSLRCNNGKVIHSL